jgi:TIR domain
MSKSAGPQPGSAADQRGGVLDFFISYTHADRPWAEWIAWQLEDAGYRTAVQAWDSLPGDDFLSWMDRAIRSAKHVLVVLSPAYVEATSFTNPEWTAALGRDPTGERGVLVPVRVADFTPDGLLRTRVWVDLVGKDENAARAELLEGARRHRRKPTIKPVFPTQEGTISTPAGEAEQPSPTAQPGFPGPDPDLDPDRGRRPAPVDCLREPMRQLAEMSARFGTRMPVNTARRISLRMTFVPTVRDCLAELECVDPGGNWPDISWAANFSATRGRAVDGLLRLEANLDRDPSQDLMDLLRALEQLRESVVEKYPQMLDS